MTKKFQIGVADIIQPKYLPGDRVWTAHAGNNSFGISGHIVGRVNFSIIWKEVNGSQLREESLEYLVNSSMIDESKLYPSYEAALKKLAEYIPQESKPND